MTDPWIQVTVMHAAFAEAISDVQEAAGRGAHDRDRIDDRVSGYLGSGWTGIAANSFVEAWAEWKIGATDVLEGLVAMGELLEATQKDFIQQDDASEQAMNQIAARIVDRLG
ncbi:MAG: WXG100 family type VII secretion target [Nocardioides sp.]|nr:WXG100 family type VII secretion target [Nocardioides sp.]